MKTSLEFVAGNVPTMTSVLDLSACVPLRSPTNWELLEKRNKRSQNEFRKNQSNDKRNLPLSILVKIRGPPKIVDSYKLNVPGNSALEKAREMNGGASCTPVNITPFEDLSDGGKRERRVIVLRPALQQCRQVPGRYFPKPTLMDDQQRGALSSREVTSLDFAGEKCRTETSISIASTKVSKSLSKVTDTSRNKRANYSNSVNPKIFHTRKTLFERADEKSNLFSISVGGPGESYDQKSEFHNDHFTVRRNGSLPRQVTFPQKSLEFREMLTGTTKTLHERRFLLTAPSGEQTDLQHEPTTVCE